MGESSDDHDVDVEIRDEEMSISSKLGTQLLLSPFK